ncbi:helix-turn-helix DNA binding protein [Arthrobacter phage EvePickles]|nr:helix-turn-helix DNA binding protein [Arthrobacter phage EvePickles]
MALEDTTWSEDAVAAIINISHAQLIFSADDLAREIRKPPHPNMVGAAFTAARAAGHIRPIGYQTSTTKSRNGGVIRSWTRCTKKAGAS